MKLNDPTIIRKFKFWFWGIFTFGILLTATLFTLIAFEFFGPMPTFKQLENPKSNIASEVISEDNVVLGNIYKEYRSFVDYHEISPNVINALIATEDARFHKHSGIDFRGLGRVIVKTVLIGNRSAGGGSTITQQLAKNLFPRNINGQENKIVRTLKLVLTKFKEWITAVKLERNYTKEEIAAMYLNVVEFGSNAFGIKAAAKTFFDTTPDSLKIEQAALLVGIVNAPTRYSPILNPEKSLARRNIVLGQMYRYGYISKQEFDSLSSIPIQLKYKLQNHNRGIATYFREMLRLFMTAKEPNPKRYYSHELYKEDSLLWETNPLYGWCNKNKKPDGTPYNIYTDGLKIYTTINSRMQRYAEEALKSHLKDDLQPALDNEIKNRGNRIFYDITQEQVKHILYSAMRQTQRYRGLVAAGASRDSIIENFNQKIPMRVFSWDGDKDTIMSPLDSIKYYKKILRSSFMAMDPHNGNIRAYIGGPDFRYFKYDMVRQGKRQVGSTIKPFLYTLAMQEGYSPCTKVPNVNQTFVVGDTIWSPRNSGRSKYDGQMVTLKWGLANSVNNISAWIMKQFSPEAVVEMIKQLGIRSHIEPVPSIFLGTFEFSLYEMVAAYSTFVNKGIRVEPIFVTRIEDKNGNVLSSFNTKKQEVISEQTAFLMINLLEGVVNQGTGIRLRYKYNLPGLIGGKTGTTQNHSDGWFMGITPNLVAGVWTGAEDRSVHFERISLGQGANMALPIFALFMKKVYADSTLNVSPDDDWQRPIIGGHINLDCEDQNTDYEINEIEIY
ncbi:MAG: penicillin-binding protein [Tenuifilum sp.]|jgi:penicillin-binding protein 1A|uniref:penicillin-binding protein 1A n=1 Tax=Tenuifilum sp. TaxID=2760880 RepID=UPI0024AB4E7F|nr:transglycosylase domain-containing protein [Tenuifilum sp.]MDI3525908.1 penicillin-binding protein [Tenuifilum sp.]